VKRRSEKRRERRGLDHDCRSIDSSSKVGYLFKFFLDSILPLAVLDGDNIYGVDQVDEMCSVKDRRKDKGGNRRLMLRILVVLAVLM
jgi:hypothetical protein